MTRRPGRSGYATGAKVLLPFILAAAVLVGCSSTTSVTGVTATNGRVLLVGTFKGHSGRYRTIQSAVNAARPGDWILVAPGDYHETADKTTSASDASHGDFGGVLSPSRTSICAA